MNPMQKVRIAKATINIGVGEAGEKLARAEKLLETITHQKPVRTYSKITNPSSGSGRVNPWPAKSPSVKKAHDAVKMVLDGVGNKLRTSQWPERKCFLWNRGTH